MISTRSILHGESPCSKSPFSITSLAETVVHEALVLVVAELANGRLELVWFDDVKMELSVGVDVVELI